MNRAIQAGDRVKLIAIPGLADWLLCALPDEEKNEIVSFAGKTATITEIDGYGYLWVDFSRKWEDEDNACCSGHSFCVTRECLAYLAQCENE